MGRTAAWPCAAATSSGELPLDGASTAALASSSRAAQSVCPSEAALNRGEQPLARQRFTSTLGLAASSSTTSAWPPCTAAKRAGGTTGADWSRSSRTADASPKTHARSTSEASRWWSSWLVGAGASAVRCSSMVRIRWTLRGGPSLGGKQADAAGSVPRRRARLLNANTTVGALAFPIPRVAAVTRNVCRLLCSHRTSKVGSKRAKRRASSAVHVRVVHYPPRSRNVARPLHDPAPRRRFLLHHTDARPTHTLQPTIHHGF